MNIVFCHSTVTILSTLKTFELWSKYYFSRMTVAAPMKDLIVMIGGRSSRDHEAIPREPQKRAKQEPQIEMVLKLFTISNRLNEFLIDSKKT